MKTILSSAVKQQNNDYGKQESQTVSDIEDDDEDTSGLNSNRNIFISEDRHNSKMTKMIDIPQKSRISGLEDDSTFTVLENTGTMAPTEVVPTATSFSNLKMGQMVPKNIVINSGETPFFKPI